MLGVTYLLKTNCWLLSFIDILNAFCMTLKGKSFIAVQNLAYYPQKQCLPGWKRSSWVNSVNCVFFFFFSPFKITKYLHETLNGLKFNMWHVPFFKQRRHCSFKIWGFFTVFVLVCVLSNIHRSQRKSKVANTSRFSASRLSAEIPFHR